jgi:hypothetical protein
VDSNDLRAALIASGQFEEPHSYPAYLAQYHWAPSFVLRHAATRLIVGFEVVYVDILPRRILAEARKAQQQHDDFAVALAVSRGAESGTVVAYCRQQGFGLWVFTSGAVAPLLPPRGGITRPARRRAPRDGWIPPAIAGLASPLPQIRVAPIIKARMEILSAPGTPEPEAIGAVESVLAEITNTQRNHLTAPLSFYHLAGLQKLLRLHDPQASDHVVHSFRVYVTGCIVISHLWDLFSHMWKTYTGLTDAAIDDVWFLVGMFHDCGYRRDPVVVRAAAEELGLRYDENGAAADVLERLSRDEYQQAIARVASFLAHIARRRPGRWDFGSLPGGALQRRLEGMLADCYSSGEYHGVVSALDMAAELFISVERASADGTEDRDLDRQFLASHVFPAAAAIALHDWHLWDRLRELGIFPLEAEFFPLAALLIYLDTWDDYRRRGRHDMEVVSLETTGDGVVVTVRWTDPERMANAAVGYGAYGNQVKWPANMQLKIVLVGG